MRPGWKNAKHADQWANTLATYAYPKLGNKPVNAIETNDVQEVLAPIWKDKLETATRVRGRIEAVLSAAKARGLRSGENPALWRETLDKLLPAISQRRPACIMPRCPGRRPPRSWRGCANARA